MRPERRPGVFVLNVTIDGHTYRMTVDRSSLKSARRVLIRWALDAEIPLKPGQAESLSRILNRVLLGDQ